MDKLLPTQEQIKEFWEQYGFEYLPKGSRDKFHRLDAIKYPDGTIHSTAPSVGLSSVFRHVVPKVEADGLTIDLVSFQQASGSYYAEWRIYKEKDGVKCGELVAKDWQTGTNLEEITALALFWALRQIKEAKE